MVRTVPGLKAEAARGVIHELAMLLVLLGLAVQSAVPALSLMVLAGSLAGHPLASFICHVPRPGDNARAPGGEAPATGDACCLVCQAAQLAKGALPPPTLHIPTASAALSFSSVAIRLTIGGQASLHKLPRGPPA